jgi:putative endonuclease
VVRYFCSKSVSSSALSERSESNGRPYTNMPFVYMAQNSDGKLYVGVSMRPDFRLKEHNTQRGSVFTKSGNFNIIFQEEYSTLSMARKREIQIKKWRRDKKEQLITRYQKGLSTKINGR